MEIHTRRQFLNSTMMTLLTLIFARMPLFSRLEIFATPENPKIVHDCMGIVDAPTPGGSMDYQLAAKQYEELGMKSVMTFDPSAILISTLINTGMDIIARAHQRYNRFDEKDLSSTIKKLIDCGVTPVIQPYNEVNLAAENGDQEIAPENHMKDFLKASELIAASGGRCLFTPLAQNPYGDPRSETISFTRMIQVLKELNLPKEWYEKHFGLAFHMYLFSPKEKNFWQRIENLYNIYYQIIGIEVPIYITEAGLLIDENHRYIDEEKVIADTTEDMVKADLPEKLGHLIKGVYFWLGANFAQRPDDHKGDPRAQKHEDAAWISKNDNGLVYREVYNRIRDFSIRRALEKKEKIAA